MNDLIRLLKGEMRRLNRYKILPISIFTSLIWVAVYYLVTAEEARHIAPVLLFADIAMMSIVLIGASYNLERQERTLASEFVLPVKKSYILLSKLSASLFLAIESAVITAVALYVIHGITFNYLWLLGFVIISTLTHATIGFALTLSARDFNALLGLMMTFIFLCGVPTLFYSLGIIPDAYEPLLFLSPSHCANYLMDMVVNSRALNGRALFALGYQTALAWVIYRYLVVPRFNADAVKEV